MSKIENGPGSPDRRGRTVQVLTASVAAGALLVATGCAVTSAVGNAYTPHPIWENNGASGKANSAPASSGTHGETPGQALFDQLQEAKFTDLEAIPASARYSDTYSARDGSASNEAQDLIITGGVEVPEDGEPHWTSWTVDTEGAGGVTHEITSWEGGVPPIAADAAQTFSALHGK